LALLLANTEQGSKAHQISNIVDALFLKITLIVLFQLKRPTFFHQQNYFPVDTLRTMAH
jgi:hypothetical protein